MKVIDLLNKIANGDEVPKKIIFENEIYNYDDKDYFNEKNSYLFDREYLPDILNEEVKEKKEIEELNGLEFFEVYKEKSNLLYEEKQVLYKNYEIIGKKINEIIKLVNEIENKLKKGE